MKHFTYITELVSGKEAYNALDLMYPIAIRTVDHARELPGFHARFHRRQMDPASSLTCTRYRPSTILADG